LSSTSFTEARNSSVIYTCTALAQTRVCVWGGGGFGWQAPLGPHSRPPARSEKYLHRTGPNHRQVFTGETYWNRSDHRLSGILPQRASLNSIMNDMT
jgi:hypothetical protein